jgi:hypothetical protein
MMNSFSIAIVGMFIVTAGAVIYVTTINESHTTRIGFFLLYILLGVAILRWYRQLKIVQFALIILSRIPFLTALSATAYVITVRGKYDLVLTIFLVAYFLLGHVDEILRFACDLMVDPPRNAHLLVHCHMGTSRSSAALALILARVRPDLPAPQILDEVFRVRRRAWPNLRMIELGDVALERKGELIEALSAVYRLKLQRHPELQRYFIECGRKREVDHAFRGL